MKRPETGREIKLKAVDLHVHSNRSDGTLSPAQLVDYAMKKGLAAFALTDHDTIDGLKEAIEYAGVLGSRAARQTPGAPSQGGTAGTRGAQNTPCPHTGPNTGCPQAVPEVIPGIELSAEYQSQDIHIVGLYIDYHNDTFIRKLREFVDSRDIRNRKMCRRLQEAGIPIDYEELVAQFPDSVITRAHYAKYMLNHGYIKSMKEAFDRYVGDYAPCFVPREKVTPVQAVELILEAGGIPVLAHPVLYPISDIRLEQLTAELKEAGLMGLEAIYATYSPADERRMRALAQKYGLCVSGGSDFHGSNKPGLDLGTGYGSLYVPWSVLEELIRRRAHAKAAGI